MLFDTIHVIYYLLRHDPTVPVEQTDKFMDYIIKQVTLYKGLVTIKEARGILNVSRKTLISYIQSGSLKPVNRPSEEIFFDEEEVLSLAKEKAMNGMDEETDSPRKGRSKLRGRKQAPKATTSNECREGD